MRRFPALIAMLLVPLAAYSPFQATAANVIELDFAPAPLARFEKELNAIRQKNNIAQPNLAPDEVVAVRFARANARAQERWIDGEVEIRCGKEPFNTMRVEVALYALGGAQPVAQAVGTPSQIRGALHVDLRSAGLTRARVVVTLVAAGKTLGVAETFVSAQSAPALTEGQRLSLIHISEPTRPY